MKTYNALFTVAALAASHIVHGAEIAVPSVITSSTTVILNDADTIGTLDIRTQNGAILTIVRSSTNGGTPVFPPATWAAAGATSLVLDGSDGRIVFRDINLAVNDSQAAIIRIDGNATNLATVNITGVDFLRNSAGGVSNGVSGVIQFNKAGVTTTLTDVTFIGNYTRGNSAISRIAAGSVTFTDALFQGNFAPSTTGAGGVFDVRGTGTLTVTNAIFDSNRVRNSGGVFTIVNGTPPTVNLTDVTFKDNWAGTYGGAFQHTVATRISINLTGSATNSYIYSGNRAGFLTTAETTEAMVFNNNAPAAVARAGGFYYSTAATTLDLNIASGVSLSIGDAAATNKAADSIASTVNTGTILKNGAGSLVLNADNAYWQGRVTVNAGSLILGNNNARLGGIISLANGVTFGGSGTLVTFSNDGADNMINTNVTAGNGTTIQVGNGGMNDRLTITGALDLGSDTTFSFNLFNDNRSSALQINGAFNMNGTGTIRLDSIASGTFTLIQWGSTNVTSASQFDVDASAFSRVLNIAGSLVGNSYQLAVELANSSSLAWTGNDGNLWQNSGAQANWNGMIGGGAITDFQGGDTVYFDATGANRAITIEPGMVSVAAMTVTSAADYSFAGGAIVSGSTLVKTGAGTLTFANSSNMFDGGIQIGDASTTGGMIVFDNPGQLGVGENSAIHFVNTGTLRPANLSMGGAIAANIIIDDGKTAVIFMPTGSYSVSNALSLSGAISGGPTAVFELRGGLVLTGDSGAFEGTTNITPTADLFLSDGTLGGTVNVGPNATFGGIGAAHTVTTTAGSEIRVSLSGGSVANTLSIANLQLADNSTITGHGTLSGTATIATGAITSVHTGSGATIALAATLGGNGELVKTGQGTLNISTGELRPNTLTLQEGILRASGGIIDVHALNIGADAVLRGAGTITVGVLSNTGTIRVGRAGGDATHGTLTINGNYTGGGSVELAFSNGADQKDILNINGAVTGTTDLILTPLIFVDTKADLPANLVTIDGGLGEVPEGAFNVLGDGILIGVNPYPYTYDPVTAQWSQRDVPISTVPAVAGLDATTLLIGKASLASLSQRLAALRDTAGPEPMQFWLTGLYRNDKISAGAYENAANVTTGVQIGADWTCAVNDSATRFTLGFFLDYASADMDMDRDIASTTTKSTAFGAYARLRGSNWYADAIIRTGNLDYTVSIPGKPDFDTKGKSWAAAFEIGCATPGFSGWAIEPQLQLIYQNNYMDDAIDSQGLVYRGNGTESLEGRAGARIWRQFKFKNDRAVTPYARASVVYEFKGDGKLLVSDDHMFASDLGGAAVMVDAGVNVQLTRRFSMNAGASWLNGSKIGSYALNLGAAFSW